MKIFWLFLINVMWGTIALGGQNVQSIHGKILLNSDALLNEHAISYVYGGSQLGTIEECKTCNRCLGEKSPSPKQRFNLCPECRKCSLDCSHFIQLVYQKSGLKMPYLTTKTMLKASKRTLFKNYSLMDIGRHINQLQTGDLLVYKGHVVLLEKLHKNGYGDVIHATGGKDIREPGQGVQRERMAPLINFRGPMLRVLRHKKLMSLKKLRPIKR